MDSVNVRNHSKPATPNRRPPRYLTAPAKAWLTVIGFVGSVDGLIWIWVQGMAASSAYNLVLDIAPQAAWGWAMSLVGVFAWLAIQFDGHRWAPEFGRLALALYGVITFIVGFSIFSLTLNGTVSALTGSTKWWGMSLACFVGLLGPTMTTTRRVTFREWVGLD